MTRAKDISKIVTDANLSGTLDVTGEVNLSANLNLGDNDKAIFGAGSDLQIYHDGSNSYVKDAGTGSIVLEGQDLYLNSTVGTYLRGVQSGAVTIFHNDSAKLTTTSTGIDVTGTATMDGLTVDTSNAVQFSSSNVRLHLFETDTTNLNTELMNQSGKFWINTIPDDASSSKVRLSVDHASGDISFYEDTGTTPKLFWDASAERLGIGNSSPTNKLEISANATDLGMLIYNTSTGSASRITLTNSEGSGFIDQNNNLLRFAQTGSTDVAIDSSGNLLVSTTVSSGSNAPHNTNSATYEGFVLGESGSLLVGSALEPVGQLNAIGYDGDILRFRKDGTTVGSIGTLSSYLNIGTGAVGLMFVSGDDTIRPHNIATNTARDDAIDLGEATVRFDDIRATNGTIQTSDQQEKNTITDSDLGIDFIKRLTPKSYIFNGKTRTHYGLIAQDVETVLSDISKPTSGFAGFIKDDISEEQDGSEYRYGLRYTEFVAPLIQAVKDQQATIDALTARITALENGV